MNWNYELSCHGRIIVVRVQVGIHCKDESYRINNNKNDNDNTNNGKDEYVD